LAKDHSKHKIDSLIKNDARNIPGSKNQKH